MEKRTPHTRLSVVKKLVQDGNVRATRTSLEGADALGLTFDDMCAAVLGLEAGDFYKSMTTYHDHTVWQEVYRPILPCGEVYLKLTVQDGVLIVSFKEK